MKLAGYDVGYSAVPSAGVGILDGDSISLQCHVGGDPAYQSLAGSSPYEVVAIDGPIIPHANDSTVARSVESLFQRGKFQRRCKPGASHVSGTGQRLRQAAGQAADVLATMAPAVVQGVRPVRAGAVVEAFPNAFLGVCASEDVYAEMPNLRRGKKFDWLYEQWGESRFVEPWIGRISLEFSTLAKKMPSITNHDERAALVCLMTAACVAVGSFTAIGDDRGGWFYLPPWAMWASWAQEEASRQAVRLTGEGWAVKIIRVGSQ